MAQTVWNRKSLCTKCFPQGKYIKDFHQSFVRLALVGAGCLNTTIKINHKTTMELDKWLIDDIKRRKQRIARRGKVSFCKPILVMIFVFLSAYIVVEGVHRLLSSLTAVHFINTTYAEAIPPQEHKVVVATITAYTSSIDETDSEPFITASGERTTHGTIACPSKYDFGTVVVIEGRQYKCNDRMNRRYRSQERFDIWVETKAEAFEWGVREINIKVLAIR